MNFDINLIRDVEALLPNCVREDFLEHYSDWAEISSLMVDIKWEIKFIDLAGLDQIVVLGDVEEAAQSRGDPQHPLWNPDEQIYLAGRKKDFGEASTFRTRLQCMVGKKRTARPGAKDRPGRYGSILVRNFSLRGAKSRNRANRD